MSNRDYFKGIIGIGNLDIEQILYEDIYPVFFVCKDKGGKRYLCLCNDIVGEQKWVLVPTSTDIIINVITDKITLYDAFKQSGGTAWIIRWSNQDNKDNNTSMDALAIPDTELPRQGEFF